MAKRIIDEDAIETVKHPIRPEYINTGDHFWDAFDKSESETAARIIVLFCQQKQDGWTSFSLAEIREYRQSFKFYSLVNEERGFVILGHDGRYRVTHEFICRCFAASPESALIPSL